MDLMYVQLRNKTKWIFYVLLSICVFISTMMLNNSLSENRRKVESVITRTNYHASGELEKRATEEQFVRRIIKVFDSGPQFDASFSPLYQNKSSTIIGRNTRHENFVTDRLVLNVDCSLLFKQNSKEIERVRNLNTTSKSPSFCNQTNECNKFLLSRGYIMDPLTDEERDFSIAYSILVYESPEQFEILLRAIYRPQNAYCVHVDRKTTENVFNEFSCIAQCFPNVKLASKRIEVDWGEIGVVLAELLCMKDLLSFSKWKYFINLTGQEFPLRTNYELVKILKIYNGSNDGEGTIKRANKDRWEIGEKPPHNIHPVKGSVHVTLNRKFVEYLVNSSVAADFFTWVNKTKIPDETYFATLIHNPQLGIPGSFKGDLETDFGVQKPFLSRFKNWESFLPCKGKYVRSICIFGVGDLPLLARRPEFFANKFHLDYQRESLLCMDELIFNRTWDEYYQRLHFDTEYYKNLKHIRNIV